MPYDPKSKKVAEATATKNSKHNEQKNEDTGLIADITTNHKHIVKRQDQS